MERIPSPGNFNFASDSAFCGRERVELFCLDFPRPDDRSDGFDNFLVLRQESYWGLGQGPG